jgi:peptidyl-prolyl cis-trans isomerase D
MFDLFRSRAKAVRIFLGALLVLVALSMVTYLIPGGFGGGGAQDQVIAEIGKETLTYPQFTQQMEMAKRNKAIPAGAGAAFAQQMLDQMISSRALLYEAKRMGLTVTDAEVANRLRSLMPQLFPNGQFVGTQVYAAVLEQQGMTIPEFEDEIRREMLMNKLTDVVSDTVVVTPQDVTREYQRRNEKAKLDYIALTEAKYKNDVNISPAQVRAYYESTRAQYHIPEKRSFEMVVADAAKISQTITIPDAELRKFYDQNKEQYRVPERVKVRHILLKTTDKPAADIPKIQAQAESILKQLQNGANFAELARKYSEDPGSAEKGGDLGWVVRGQTVKAFEDAAFSLKPGQLSGVIKTEYGFHILQVMDKEPGHVKPFEEVKDQIAAERKRQQVYDTMERLADQAHDELTRHPQQVAEIASKLGLEVVTVNQARAGQPVPVFGRNPDFSDAIASLPVGGVTQVMQAPGDKLAVAVVTGITPQKPAELSDVEGPIRDLLARQDLTALLVRKANEAMEQAKASGGDLKKVAQQMGLEVKTTQSFSPDGAADGIGPASLLQAAFDQPVGSVFGPVTVGDERFICKVVEQTPADMSKLNGAERADIRASLVQQRSRQRIELFIDSVRAALIREGKVKIHQQVYERAIAANKG